ncbi:MAG: disulfide bond formation protein B [Rhodospirillaceae bacterium]|jgi:disulfide bond formation protein DsbB|nr:disulfide bond formation protein B [Rhodospirillaceae bacterium]MBT4939882.1 disulfide bond formation protein B [Rhodospirillaceae bacterium]MBT7955901.1 disulfide bond formation protein B [Rhodospirillaceae bacterium]
MMITEKADKIVLGVLLLASIGALATAFTAQYVFGLEPCILCKYQRVPYFAVILFAGIGMHIEMADHAGTLKVVGVIFLLGAALAFYHNGVEQHWWEAATSCGSGGGDTLTTFKNFANQLMTKMPKRCDQIDWTLFGLSMTVYNTVTSIGLAAVSFFGAAVLRNYNREIE